MEKRKPHYPLADIQKQMGTVESLNMTQLAKTGMRLAGMVMSEALSVVRSLKHGDFHKSMTTHANVKVWQDVYHAQWRGKPLYVKFQKHDKYFVVSFKEQ